MLALFGGQLVDRSGHDHISGAVPIGIRVITGVIARALGLVFMPFLRHGHAGNHHMLDAIGRHGLEQLVHACRLLEEVDVMQVRVAVGIVAGVHGQAAGAKQEGKGQVGPGHDKISIQVK